MYESKLNKKLIFVTSLQMGGFFVTF